MTEKEFNAYWTLLCERFGRTPSAPLTRIYGAYVRAQELSAAEWAQGVETAVIHETFMPSPQRLVDLARGGLGFEGQAQAEWDTCMARMVAGEQVTEPGSLTRRVLLSATNHQGLHEIPSKALPFVQKTFIERYAAELMKQAQAKVFALVDGPSRRVLPNAS